MLAAEPAFDFIVPPANEAVEPPEAHGVARDRVRLLVSDRRSGATEHARFDALPSFLQSGDLLVANDSATLPAAVQARRENGEPLTVHVSSHIARSVWIVEPRGNVEAGETLFLPGAVRATLLAPAAGGTKRLWCARIEPDVAYVAYLQMTGEPIRYPYVTRSFPIAAYQTIFARTPGSAEMPSAGRPFSAETLAALARKNVSVATITLHAGVSSPEAHEPPQAEAFFVSPATASAVNSTRAAGRGVIAIGTTVVRALESAARAGAVVAAQGRTELLISPERRATVVDGLLTGLHEPKASHLAMLEAFLERGALARAYGEALRERYLWHEFGDVHLIVAM